MINCRKSNDYTEHPVRNKESRSQIATLLLRNLWCEIRSLWR